MGVYLNSRNAYTLYKDETAKPYFVDKTRMLEEIFPLLRQGSSYICITRPRRFGKTMAADMIASYLSKAYDARNIFDRLYVSDTQEYKEHLNKYDVIHISFNELPKNCQSYQQYMNRIESRLVKDLMNAYPEADISKEDALWDVLTSIHMQEGAARFVFILDEWDYIFHRDFITNDDKRAYIEFLSNLLKGKPYVIFAYMTGILPIAKYSSGSELNMFLEYTMATEEKYSGYFGFTETEVDDIFNRYLLENTEPKVTREGLRIWYDGYHTKSGERVYNPRSVVASLTNNNLGSYWTSSGPYDEIFYYVKKNTADVRDDLALMVSGIPVSARVQEYAATSMNLTTKDEIFSAMVVYGFLSYKDGYMTIPNKELLDKFADMLQKEPALDYVYNLARESERLLRATRENDTDTMRAILEHTHNTEIPLLSYNKEEDLTVVVTLSYLSARNLYRIEREEKAGVGYVDFIFYPIMNRNDDCIILELKVDAGAEEAVKQIKDKKYALRFAPKLGGEVVYTGRILAVGIAYDRVTKEHSCMVEVLRDGI